jgi:hypothetical protein
MSRKRHRPDEIVAKLRQVEVLTAQRRSVADAIRSIGGGELRDELLNREIVYPLQEAKIVIEGGRRHHNTLRPPPCSAPSRPRQRSCCGRLRFPDQLRWPPRPSRSDPLCTSIRPRPLHGGFQGRSGSNWAKIPYLTLSLNNVIGSKLLKSLAGVQEFEPWTR